VASCRNRRKGRPLLHLLSRSEREFFIFQLNALREAKRKQAGTAIAEVKVAAKKK
jgi:hypothetical protein